MEYAIRQKADLWLQARMTRTEKLQQEDPKGLADVFYQNQERTAPGNKGTVITAVRFIMKWNLRHYLRRLLFKKRTF
ncbi:hypothetical protein [Niabella sp.]|uniref:hypothetical protein n=1 Tax=Niabella sp. TaxID=1962976 RepID=UPI002620FAE4|nr:hypothetical protein [Niabella sp.]